MAKILRYQGMLSSSEPVSRPRTPASYRQRIVASGVDSIILFPLGYLFVWAGQGSRFAAMLAEIPMQLCYVAYIVYGHGRYGRTLGKHLMRIRVARLDGSKIGWTEARRRSSVDFWLSLVALACGVIALARLSDGDFQAGLAHAPWGDTRPSDGPVWLRVLDVVFTLWVASDVFSVCFSPERRSLHDYIGGTIVVSDVPALAGRAAEDVNPNRA